MYCFIVFGGYLFTNIDLLTVKRLKISLNNQKNIK